MKSISKHIAVWGLGAALLGLACGEDKVTNPVEPRGYASSEACIQGLARSYRERDITRSEELLSCGTGLPAYLFVLNEPDPDTGETVWGCTTEIRIHRRMFRPQDFAMTDPVPMENWLQSIDITLTRQTDFAERPDLYTTANPPGDVDPARWIAREAFYGTYVFFQLAGDIDYQVNGRAAFIVIEDKTKANGEVGKFLLYRWQDLGTARTKIWAT